MKILITASEYEKESIIYIHKYWNEMQYGRLIPIINDIYGHDLIYLQRFLILQIIAQKVVFPVVFIFEGMLISINVKIKRDIIDNYMPKNYLFEQMVYVNAKCVCYTD